MELLRSGKLAIRSIGSLFPASKWVGRELRKFHVWLAITTGKGHRDRLYIDTGIPDRYGLVSVSGRRQEDAGFFFYV